MNQMARRSPSGHQYVLVHGDQRAEIAQVGATLRTFTVGGLDVVDGFGADERSVDGRGQVLAPWPNRLTDGRYRYGEHDCQAPLDEPDRHDAIHGLVRWLDWVPVAHDATTVTLACGLHPQPGYEWHLDLEVTYALTGAGLTVTLEARNGDTEPAPFGAGFHPYLGLATHPVDRLLLTVPASATLDPAAPGGQAALVEVDGGPLDHRLPRPVGPTRLDTCFGALVRGADGRAVARLEDPVSGRSVELWVDVAYRYLMVYTADEVERAERRRASVAIEPMTCPPDAFRTGTDLVELGPGDTWRGAWGIRATGEAEMQRAG